MSNYFLHGVKDLKISGPTNVSLSNSQLRCTVILIAKFDFDAETANELSVKKGDVLKLLDRLANGWVLVEFIDKIASPGLVPSLYVDIAVNDPSNPVTLLWLHELSGHGTDANNTFNDIQVRMLLESNAPFSINNKLYPLSVSVTNYLLYRNRFWYRVDVTYSLGEQGYLCRHYQDFYDLNLSLLDYLNGAEKTASNDQMKLPNLPELVPNKWRNSAEQGELFSRRCRELSAYMNELISTKRFQVCSALVDWLDVGFKKSPGCVVADTPLETNDVINQWILPGSVILATKSSAAVSMDLPKLPDHALENVKFSPPSRDVPTWNKQKYIYNHYQQAADVNVFRSFSTSEGRYCTQNNSRLERARTFSTTNNNPPKSSYPYNDEPSFGSACLSPTLHKSKNSKFGPSAKMASPVMAPSQRFPQERHQAQTLLHKTMSPVTPLCPNPSAKGKTESDIPLGLKTPSSAHGTPQLTRTAVFLPRENSFGTPNTCKLMSVKLGKPVRCEIKTQTNDNIIVRVNVLDLPHIHAFKSAIYLKFAYNNLYVRVEETGSYEEIDSPEYDMMKIILLAETVFMFVT